MLYTVPYFKKVLGIFFFLLNIYEIIGITGTIKNKVSSINQTKGIRDNFTVSQCNAKCILTMVKCVTRNKGTDPTQNGQYRNECIFLCLMYYFFCTLLWIMLIIFACSL